MQAFASPRRMPFEKLRVQRMPSFDNLDDFAQALDVSVAHLFSFQELT